MVGRHFSLFADKIFNEHELWYKILNEYLDSSNKDDSSGAFKVLDVFYIKMADMFKKYPDKNNSSIFQVIFFMLF